MPEDAVGDDASAKHDDDKERHPNQAGGRRTPCSTIARHRRVGRRRRLSGHVFLSKSDRELWQRSDRGNAKIHSSQSVNVCRRSLVASGAASGVPPDATEWLRHDE